jgi:hypothetical protein
VTHLILAVILMTTQLSVREPVVVGRFYPGDRAALQKEVKGYLEAAPDPKIEGPVLALVSPHAGYSFSGPTAGRAMKALAGSGVKRVLLIGTGHAAYYERGAVLADYDAFATPLGPVPVDRAAVAGLAKQAGFKVANHLHAREHSLEVQLPFLQEVLREFSIVPMVMGGQTTPEDADAVARGLRPLLGEKTILVLSTDFTHYGPNYDYVPFREEVSARMRALDWGAWELVRPGFQERFAAYIETTGATVCGEKGLMVLCALLPSGAKKTTLQYTSSGEVLQDYDNAVGYLAGAFTGQWNGPTPTPARKPHSGNLAAAEKKALVRLARGALVSHVAGADDLSRVLRDLDLTPGLTGVAGAFVTLKVGEDLRGCIGSIEGREPLWLSVVHNAANAATRDPRFRPVRPEELTLLSVEVSALSPMKPVASYKDIVLGTHGVVLEKRGRSAVFLPQVATETGWTLDQFLSHLAQKAGLAASDWKDGASFRVFTAEVIHE